MSKYVSKLTLKRDPAVGNFEDSGLPRCDGLLFGDWWSTIRMVVSPCVLV